MWRRILPTTGRSHLSEVLQGIFIIITCFIYLIISFDHHHDQRLQLLPHQHLVDVVLPLRAPSSQGSFLSNTLTGSPGSNIQHKGRRSHFHLERLMTKILFSQQCLVTGLINTFERTAFISVNKRYDIGKTNPQKLLDEDIPLIPLMSANTSDEKFLSVPL